LFEMFGNRGIYHDGCMASTPPVVAGSGPQQRLAAQ
jgi:hypothetical protein